MPMDAAVLQKIWTWSHGAVGKPTQDPILSPPPILFLTTCLAHSSFWRFSLFQKLPYKIQPPRAEFHQCIFLVLNLSQFSPLPKTAIIIPASHRDKVWLSKIAPQYPSLSPGRKLGDKTTGSLSLIAWWQRVAGHSRWKCELPVAELRGQCHNKLVNVELE